MDFPTLLLWLSESDPSDSSLQLQRTMVQPALKDFPSEAYDLRQSIMSKLQGDESAAASLEELWQQFGSQLRKVEPVRLSEAYLWIRAQLLKAWECRTEKHQEFMALARAGTPNSAPLRAHFQSCWHEYCQLQLSPSEVTVESVAYHRTLKRAVEGWLQSLDFLDEGRVEEALELADESNRLLVAVQKPLIQEIVPCVP